MRRDPRVARAIQVEIVVRPRRPVQRGQDLHIPRRGALAVDRHAPIGSFGRVGKVYVASSHAHAVDAEWHVRTLVEGEGVVLDRDAVGAGGDIDLVQGADNGIRHEDRAREAVQSRHAVQARGALERGDELDRWLGFGHVDLPDTKRPVRRLECGGGVVACGHGEDVGGGFSNAEYAVHAGN